MHKMSNKSSILLWKKHDIVVLFNREMVQKWQNLHKISTYANNDIDYNLEYRHNNDKIISGYEAGHSSKTVSNNPDQRTAFNLNRPWH